MSEHESRRRSLINLCVSVWRNLLVFSAFSSRFLQIFAVILSLFRVGRYDDCDESFFSRLGKPSDGSFLRLASTSINECRGWNIEKLPAAWLWDERRAEFYLNLSLHFADEKARNEKRFFYIRKLRRSRRCRDSSILGFSLFLFSPQRKATKPPKQSEN